MPFVCVPNVLALGPWHDLTPLFHSSSLGWNKRIEYTPGAGSLALFPSIHLETCDEPLWNIQATVELQTNHVAKGCDRDNYSEKSLRKLCGELILSWAQCLTQQRCWGTRSSYLLWSAGLGGHLACCVSSCVLRRLACCVTRHPAFIYKVLLMLSLLGRQRFLCIAPLHRVCGTSLSRDRKVTILLQIGEGL